LKCAPLRSIAAGRPRLTLATFAASRAVVASSEFDHEGHEGHEEEEGAGGTPANAGPFVTFVSFVVKNDVPGERKRPKD